MQIEEFWRIVRLVMLVAISAAVSSCGTFPLASGVYPLAPRTTEQQQLDNLNCKDQAKLEANSTERQTGAFLLGLTIIGAPLAFEMEKTKQREVYKTCMEDKGYRVVPPTEQQQLSVNQVAPSSSPKIDPNRVSRPASSSTRLIAVRWTRYAELLSGSVSITEYGKNGTIRLTLPSADGNCIGAYETKDLKIGTWVISCPNGITAAGSLKITSVAGGASGVGADNDGKAISFTVGDEVLK